MLTSLVNREALGEQDANGLQLRLRLEREPRAAKLQQENHIYFSDKSSKRLNRFTKKYIFYLKENSLDFSSYLKFDSDASTWLLHSIRHSSAEAATLRDNLLPKHWPVIQHVGSSGIQSGWPLKQFELESMLESNRYIYCFKKLDCLANKNNNLWLWSSLA